MLPLIIVLAGLPADPPALRLADVIDSVSRSHPDLAADRAEVAALRERALQEGRLPDPELKSEIWNAPLTRPYALDEADTVSLGMRREWESRRARSARASIADNEAEARLASAEARRRALMREASMAFFDYLEATRGRELHLEARRIAERALELLTSAYSAGGASRDGVLLAGVELARMKADLASIDRRVATARAALNALMGRPAADPLPPPAEPDPLPPLPARPEIEQRALLSNAEVQSARRAVEGAQRSRDLALVESRTPRIMAGVDYWYNPDRDRLHGLAAMVTLSLPAFGHRHDHHVTETERQVEARTAEVAAAELRVRRETAETCERLRALDETKAIVADTLLPRVTELVAAREAGYATGSVELQDVLEAQRMLVDAKVELLETRIETLRERAALDEIAGADPAGTKGLLP